MVSHGNIMHNERMIRQAFRQGTGHRRDRHVREDDALVADIRRLSELDALREAGGGGSVEGAVGGDAPDDGADRDSRPEEEEPHRRKPHAASQCSIVRASALR